MGATTMLAVAPHHFGCAIGSLILTIRNETSTPGVAFAQIAVIPSTAWRMALNRVIKIVSSPEGRTNVGVRNFFEVQRHLTSAQTHRTVRAAAMATWRAAVATA